MATLATLRTPSPVPEGLLNVLNEQELKNLIAYMLAQGNKNAEYFKK